MNLIKTTLVWVVMLPLLAMYFATIVAPIHRVILDYWGTKPWPKIYGVVVAGWTFFYTTTLYWAHGTENLAVLASVPACLAHLRVARDLTRPRHQCLRIVTETIKIIWAPLGKAHGKWELWERKTLRVLGNRKST